MSRNGSTILRRRGSTTSSHGAISPASRGSFLSNTFRDGRASLSHGGVQDSVPARGCPSGTDANLPQDAMDVFRVDAKRISQRILFEKGRFRVRGYKYASLLRRGGVVIRALKKPRISLRLQCARENASLFKELAVSGPRTAAGADRVPGMLYIPKQHPLDRGGSGCGAMRPRLGQVLA